MREEQTEMEQIEGRNAVMEALRAGRPIDKIWLQKENNGGPLGSIIQEARRHPDTQLRFVPKEQLDHMSITGRHQGVIAQMAAWTYAKVEDMLQLAKEKGEPPFLLLLDHIEDPHNLGAIIRSANLAGAHGVIIPDHRAVGLTAAVFRASAGALAYTPVARVVNLGRTMEDLKKQGLWFVCADRKGPSMYQLDLTGPLGLVIGNEGAGVSEIIHKKCDFTAAIPMKGEIDSLNASVAAGILSFEIAHQRSQIERGTDG